jgi:hypothetical protein
MGPGVLQNQSVRFGGAKIETFLRYTDLSLISTSSKIFQTRTIVRKRRTKKIWARKFHTEEKYVKKELKVQRKKIITKINEEA